MARTTERLCISVPIEFSTRLRTAYPHVDFSTLIVQLLIYADAAGFMKRLDEIDPDDYVPPAIKRQQKANAKAIKAAAEVVASSGTTDCLACRQGEQDGHSCEGNDLEEFG